MADSAIAEKAGIGHNRGPELPSEMAVDAHLEAEYADVTQRATDLLEAEARFANVNSDEADAAATEFMVKVRSAWKTAEAGRVKEKAPYDTMAGRIHAFFKTGVQDPLQALGERINAAQTLYKRGVLMAENERLEAEARVRRAAEAKAREEAAAAARAAEEKAAQAARARNAERVAALKAEAEAAAQKAQEAAHAANRASEERAEATDALAAPAADKTRARGLRGGVSSLRGCTSFRDMDKATLDLEKLRDHIPDKALETAINSWIKANKGVADKAAASTSPADQPIRGVVIFTDYQNVGRA